MADNEVAAVKSAEPQPTGAYLIVRYILIGLAFVLVFVATAYLVFRLIRRGPITTNSTPTPTFQPGQPPPVAPIVNYPILPNPQLPPRQLQLQLLTEPLTNLPLIKKIEGVIVAQDGRGNLLFDNMTHEEKFQLERAKIEAANRLALAKEQTKAQQEQAKIQLENQRLINEQAIGLSRNELARREAELAASKEQRLAELRSQLLQQQLQNEVEKKRIKSQLILERYH